MIDKNEYDTVISAKHKLMDLKIKETISYKDLILLFVKRDFVSSYKQTILGPLWAVIQPLLTTFMFIFVFGKVAHLTTSDKAGFAVPGFLFYFCGSICWSYFSSTLQATSNTFLSNRAIMGKVYYPRFASPVATSISHLISFFIQFVMLMVAFVVYYIKGGSSIAFTPRILLVIPVILQMMLLSVGAGVIISSFTTKYRDLAMLVAFGMQLWHYLCPVAYGIGLVPQKYFKIYMLNPMTPVITTFRYAVFGGGYFNIYYFLYSFAVSIVVFFIGLVLFGRIERTFMDTI